MLCFTKDLLDKQLYENNVTRVLMPELSTVWALLPLCLTIEVLEVSLSRQQQSLQCVFADVVLAPAGRLAMVGFAFIVFSTALKGTFWILA